MTDHQQKQQQQLRAAIVAALGERDWTAADLARATGTHRSVWWRYLLGAEARTDHIEAALRVLGLAISPLRTE